MNASVMTVDFRVACGTSKLQMRYRSNIHSAVMDCNPEGNDQELPWFNTKEKHGNQKWLGGTARYLKLHIR
jgi:hypothetical protein